MDTAPPPHQASPPEPNVYAEVQAGAEFGALRRSFRGFAFPLTVGFIAWYMLYVLLSNYAGGLMGTTVVGNINVAFVLGLLQFATTFGIAWLYSRHAGAKLDPRAEAIKADIEGRPARAAAEKAAPAGKGGAA
ncbi:DUF485 domain-containing protein [Streptomyces sp. NPDC059506]|uniref:DUF485 domain-containing protein n=1 Tax=Streptomyces sp. NPDC059506 TaxID=3347751 RepID=UPI0036AE5BB3